MKSWRDIGSVRVFATHPIKIPHASAAIVSIGSTTIQARMRVAARYLYGFTADASIASICSVTRIEPSSAPKPAPMRPLATSPVMIGPISLMIENTITVGSIAFAPNCTRLARDCSERTTPVAAPASATSGNDFAPAASSWCINSVHSKGSENIAFATRLANMPSSPNHSKAAIKMSVLSLFLGIGTLVEVAIPSVISQFHAKP